MAGQVLPCLPDRLRDGDDPYQLSPILSIGPLARETSLVEALRDAMSAAEPDTRRELLPLDRELRDAAQAMAQQYQAPLHAAFAIARDEMNAATAEGAPTIGIYKRLQAAIAASDAALARLRRAQDDAEAFSAASVGEGHPEMSQMQRRQDHAFAKGLQPYAFQELIELPEKGRDAFLILVLLNGDLYLSNDSFSRADTHSPSKHFSTMRGISIVQLPGSASPTFHLINPPAEGEELFHYPFSELPHGDTVVEEVCQILTYETLISTRIEPLDKKATLDWTLTDRVLLVRATRKKEESLLLINCDKHTYVPCIDPEITLPSDDDEAPLSR